MYSTYLQRGITLVEVLVGVSIFSMVLVFTAYTLTMYLTAGTETRETVKAQYLALEGMELIRAVRDNDWNIVAGLTVDAPQYLEITPSAITIGGTVEIVDAYYERQIITETVYRNSEDDVVASTTAGATVDADSRWIRVLVSWGGKSLELKALLTNLFDV